MSVDPSLPPESYLSTLPAASAATAAATANLPVSVAPSPSQPWLPVDATCRIVNRMTEEMATLVAERALRRGDRRRMLWHIRQIAMYVCHVALQISIGEIADAFGRNRSTVAYSLRIVEDRRDDTAYDAFVAAVERMAVSVFSAPGGSDDE